MKKVVRTVWISLLSGLAFLVACTTPKGLSRAEKKQLKAERSDILTQIEQQRRDSQGEENPSVILNYRDSELTLRKRLSVINSRLGDREAQMENGQQMGVVLTEIDALQAVEPNMKKQRRKELQEQLNQLTEALKRREGACVYGSPEVIQRYGDETNRMRRQAEDIRQQLKDLDDDGNGHGKE